jgi:hypothetical protein
MLHCQTIGCMFHLGQSFWRNFQRCGLTALYQDRAVREALRCTMALGFLPIELVPRGFNLLIANSPPGLEG